MAAFLHVSSSSSSSSPPLISHAAESNSFLIPPSYASVKLLLNKKFIGKYSKLITLQSLMM